MWSLMFAWIMPCSVFLVHVSDIIATPCLSSSKIDVDVPASNWCTSKLCWSIFFVSDTSSWNSGGQESFLEQNKVVSWTNLELRDSLVTVKWLGCSLITKGAFLVAQLSLVEASGPWAWLGGIIYIEHTKTYWNWRVVNGSSSSVFLAFCLSREHKMAKLPGRLHFSQGFWCIASCLSRKSEQDSDVIYCQQPDIYKYYGTAHIKCWC